MSSFYTIHSISELHEAFGYKKPNHPLISVINLAEVAISKEMLHLKIGTPFYAITLKTKVAHPFRYGREYFDFSEGYLFGIAPNQIIEVDETSEKGELEGWALYFHPDLILGYGLYDKISDYSFFSYETKEALHLSDKEKATLNAILEKIVEEYESNMDEYSRDVLVSSIELLLNYIRRFYGRQFLTRKNQNTTILSRFKRLLKDYFHSDAVIENGLPKVSYFAKQLSLSDSYLSDLLQKETGCTAQDIIHLHVIEKAKTDLVNTNKSVSQIAFALGFEYPQYFSRLFKNKTGKTPKEFRVGLN
ncbi:AraC family transcriptional regulator [Flammeovirga sp. SJP92]|uniref:helix-turn-helix domain-containing protein n=1 Tax=Flammeovirga sp. SJP92 TaxID=1775430 RepID=UPI000786A957|nr:response regulator transcription factor [Flammeovirga sp. SJP92]KXX66905.1 transcriptional regulator [Flammeovirga sp. SJP92]